MYVRGDISFSLGNHDLTFPDCQISTVGVSGFVSEALDPFRDFGKPVTIKLEVFGQDPISLSLEGYLIRERSIQRVQMSIKFRHDSANLERLHGYVQRLGKPAATHLRKFPRIAPNAAIQTYPLRALVLETFSADAHAHAGSDDDDLSGIFGQAAGSLPQRPLPHPVSFDVGNISPGGIMLLSENPMAQALEPGHRLRILLEPRGNLGKPIQMEGIIRWTADDLNQLNGNLARNIGVQFAQMDEPNRSSYLILLKDVLERIKSQINR